MVIGMQPPKLFSALCAAFLLVAAASTASATTLNYSPTPADLYDLDHHVVYTWRLDNLTLDPASITSASITFTNIRNWDSNPNVLHIHLLDTAKNAGVASFTDDTTGATPVTDFTDDFSDPRYHSMSSWLVAAGTADTFLANHSFTTTPTTWTLNFDATQLGILRTYIANGNNVAFGFDPDCHFYNDGIKFSLNVPDSGTTLTLLTGAAVALLALHRRLQS